MYTMVLMMAMGSSADVAEFGGRSSGCSGTVATSCHGGKSGGFLGLRNRGSSCHGSTSCSGSVAVAYTGCTGSGSSCHGSDRGGFLGICKRKSNSCHGSMASSCHGYTANYGCTGMTTGCTGVIVTGTPGGAMAMPAVPGTTTTKDPTKKEE